MDWPPELPNGPQPTPTPAVLKSDTEKCKTPLYRLQPEDRPSNASVEKQALSQRAADDQSPTSSIFGGVAQIEAPVSPSSSLHNNDTDKVDVTDEEFDGLCTLSRHQYTHYSPSGGRSPSNRFSGDTSPADAVSSSRRFRSYDDGSRVEELMESASSQPDAGAGSHNTGSRAASEEAGSVSKDERATAVAEEGRRQQRFEELIMRGLWWW
ncbi:hypothetical protein LTR95_016648 [Oleoguttula sp. CCFEE 5521]